MRIYGERLPETGLEPLFEQLFRRFGIEKPVPSAPTSPVIFKNRIEDLAKFKSADERASFFRDDLSVGERVSLYRHLLEDDPALETHRRMKRVLDRATGGKHQTSARRREHIRAVSRGRTRPGWIESPESLTDGQFDRDDGGTMVRPEGESLGKTEQLQFRIGQRIEMPGHFAQPVVLEEIRPLGTGFECRVRLADGSLDETVITEQEARAIFGAAPATTSTVAPVDAEQLRLLIESARIRLAYAYDKQFAVSLSGIRTLPHQIEAVYMKMLPQPRLRFLLADDPGAGKTIMAGLLIKELKLREAIERCLIVVPAPLTIQWQDELLRFFGESFQIIHAGNDQQQLLNLWQRESQVIVSLDYAKQEDVRERVWQQRWDLVIFDEAHKCSAYTKRASGRGDEVEKTKRYQLAEKLAAEADHVLLLTATPHHGDDDRFGYFVRLLDSDLFPEPHKLGEMAGQIRREILSLGPDCPWALRRLKEDLKDIAGRRLFPDRYTHTVTFKLNHEEFNLYKAVTAYINEFLPQASGKKRNSVALARTVFQRRLASSTRAIYESLARRLKKLQNLLDELEALPPAQQAKRLAQLQGRLSDAEQDEDDLDDAARDQLVDETTIALGLDQLRTEITALRDLVARAGRVRDYANDSKLAALRECLRKAEFLELKDGRGRLLIFTEHRDTLTHIREHLKSWGYSTCEIHGGM
ncbi:MAG TPA: DEAD/DEAH box helicase, partial [Blastocatellia bacterium]|nr:DEAD/DEAH box helicase [Blastocatellia bacterium]